MARNTDKSLQKQVIYSVYVRNHTEEGTFLSIIEDLDRIKALGCDILWFMPIHPIGEMGKKGSLGCPYANKDYRTTNPSYGTMEEFRMLVDEIHARGMKCMIDVVYNHTSPDSVLVSQHPEFFYREADGNMGNKVGDWSDVVDLDYRNLDLWKYQIETLSMWSKIVDGFRCDVAPLVPMDFWKAAREVVAKDRPDFVWLAESIDAGFGAYVRSQGMDAAGDAATFEAFDLEYEYDVHESFLQMLRGKKSLENYLDLLNLQEAAYPENYNKMRFLENHDQPRIASVVSEAHSMENLLAFLYFKKGTTLIYAGQEFGDDKVPSLFEKDVIKKEQETGKNYSDLMAKLYAVKKQLGENDFFHAEAVTDSIVLATRQDANAKKYGIFSLKGERADVSVDVPDGEYTNLIDGKVFVVTGGCVPCKGEPIIFVRGNK